MSLKKVTFIYSVNTTFVQRDIIYLKSLNAKIFEIKSPPNKNIFIFIYNRIREFILSLFYINKSSVVVIWFCDYHTLIPLIIAKFLNKKSVVIVGGYDAVSSKKLNYGVFLYNNLRKKIASLNYHLCSEIWVVHKSLEIGCNNSNISGQSISGIKIFLPQLKTPFYEVPTGYDSDFWTSSKEVKIQNSILTVANINDEKIFNRKGLPLFLLLAKKLKNYNFIIAGVSKKMISKITKSENVRIIGKLNSEELKSLYSKSNFYFQGSFIEGLPNVLCEAMLCECIPIGHSVFGIKDAIGNTGLLFQNHNQVELIEDFIKTNHNNLGLKARNRIQKLYPISKRIRRFKMLLNEI